MKIIWRDTPTMCRAFLATPVHIQAKAFGGGYARLTQSDLGYIKPDKYSERHWTAHVYGVVNNDCPGRMFDNIDEAKAYVEEQAIVGLTLNLLTR
jgi:hypothetical protein